jgi:hypothetical protein
VMCWVWGVVCGVWGVGCGVWRVGCGVGCFLAQKVLVFTEYNVIRQVKLEDEKFKLVQLFQTIVIYFEIISPNRKINRS